MCMYDSHNTRQSLSQVVGNCFSAYRKRKHGFQFVVSFLRYLPKLNAILKPNVLTSSILVLINKHSSGFRLLVVVVIYIVGGLAFTIGYKKHQGRERIPNSKQWAELPGLVKV